MVQDGSPKDRKRKRSLHIGKRWNADSNYGIDNDLLYNFTMVPWKETIIRNLEGKSEGENINFLLLALCV